MTFLSLKQFVNVSITEFKMSLSSEFAYRWQVFIWVVSDAIQPIILATLWVAVADSGSRSFTADDMISYYFLVSIVSRLTQDWSIQFVSNSIIDGDFAKYLIRPFNYLSEMFGISLAIRTLRILMLIPFLLVAGLLFRDKLMISADLFTVLLFFLSVILGYLINFLLGNIFALLAFFVKQIVGLRALYLNLLSILSGEYIPLRVLAVGVFFLFEILPFRYVLSFPIEILIGSLKASQIRSGFFIAFFWLIALIIIYKVIFHLAVRKYEAEGI